MHRNSQWEDEVIDLENQVTHLQNQLEAIKNHLNKYEAKESWELDLVQFHNYRTELKEILEVEP